MHTIVFTPLLINTHTQTTLTKTHFEVKKKVFLNTEVGDKKIPLFISFSLLLSCVSLALCLAKTVCKHAIPFP